jgi:hypothetical protein
MSALRLSMTRRRQLDSLWGGRQIGGVEVPPVGRHEVAFSGHSLVEQLGVDALLPPRRSSRRVM